MQTPGPVLIVGAGGLGCPAAIRLAAAGVPLTIADDDVVEETNLARQILFTDDDLGLPKVEAAARALTRRYPDTEVTTLFRRVNADDLALVRGHKVVLDGTDNFPTRFTANRLCVDARVPLVHGAAIGWSGQVLTVLPGESACLACVFEAEPPPGAAPTCAEAGVVSPLVGIVGGWMADAALSLLSGDRPDTVDAMRVFNARTGRLRLAGLGRDPRCAACGSVSPQAGGWTNMPASPRVSLDVSAERCPMTWVRTKLAIETLPPDGVLEVVLGPGEMLDNVPRNARDAGLVVEGPESIGDDRHLIRVRRPD